MNPKTVIFFGRSGCGKGTQAQLLIKHLEKTYPSERVVYIETGAKLREFVKEVGLTQELTADIMSKGGLLPSFLPIWIWTNTFIRNLNNKEHLVLDGLSRRLYEAPILHDALKFYERQRPIVIVINISDELSKKRLLARGRADDKTNDIDSRLAWYDTNVMPTINFFRENDYYKVVDIDGEQPLEKVSADIIAAIS
jgi:adenylate kinase family enzyme